MSHQSERNTLEQGRAAFAFNCAKNASDNKHIREEYRSIVKKMPMLIKTNGLGAALAFLYSKKKDGKEFHEILVFTKLKAKDEAAKKIVLDFAKRKLKPAVYKYFFKCISKKENTLLDCVQAELNPHYEVYNNISEWLKRDKKSLITGNQEFVKEIIEKESSEYRMITMEVLAFLNWLRRFAEGLIDKGEANE